MQYIKNISNPDEDAYMSCEGIFRLHFNSNPNEEQIRIGENIVLYQKFASNGSRGFSHLVVIIDKKVYTDPERIRAGTGYEYYIYVKIIAKGMYPINDTTYWKDIEHGGYAQGKLVNIDNIGQVKSDATLKEKLEREVWNLFFPEPDLNFRKIDLGTLN